MFDLISLFIPCALAEEVAAAAAEAEQANPITSIIVTFLPLIILALIVVTIMDHVRTA